MSKELDLICGECKHSIDIVSVRQTWDKEVEILFICPYCGVGKRIKEYLYK